MMSLSKLDGALWRRLGVWLVVVAAMTATATAAHAQSSGTLFKRRGPARDSLHEQREKLLLKLDSLRWEIDNRRLGDVERELLARELNRTVIALQASMDETARAMAKIEVEAMRVAPEFHWAPGQARGYIGVVFDGPSTETMREREWVIRFLDYPLIASVEPSSPAERAGLLAGDTLLAFNGTDVRERPISLTRLLVPEQRITVRVRRDGNRRDIPVIVGEAPDYMMHRMPMAVAAPRPPIAARSPSPQARAAARPPGVVATPAPPVAAQAPEAPTAFGRVWIYNDGIAGARVETITEGLGKAVGVSEGVLVIRAAPGSPAYRSGLRDGDIIVKASGRAVENVRDLRRVVAEADETDGVRLEILRERKKRDITLRW